ncbi:MAG: molybdate ABC transporter substrate-binding protein [Oscillospiraceae bacterium]|nr:molybdate ABC transporter substrate-binding protein [Oscillospiraceae bacterium]
MKKTLALLLALCMMLTLFAACSSSNDEDEVSDTAVSDTANDTEDSNVSDSDEEADYLAETTVYLYAAASMENAFTQIIENYKEVQPNVTIVGSYDSSGTLLTQIEEANGNGIDIFFSAGKKQVTTLDETDGLVVEGSVVDLLGNALCLVTYKDSGTAVTGWDTMNLAASMALCDGTVPVGQYTRTLMVALGLLDETDDVSAYTSEEISAALDGIEINEASNVSTAAAAVVEHSNEITTCYYTDYYSYQDDLEIIVMDETGEYTGAITYPVCQVANGEADEAELAATEDFLAYIQSDEALAVFEEYCFIVNG